MTRFAGRCALVTGGSSGIGKAAVQRLAAEGARVVINGRDAAKLVQAVNELAPFGEVHGVAADVSREAEVARLVAEALAKLGSIDILVHSAGVDGEGAAALDLTTAGWERLLAANLTAPFLVTRAVGRVMATAGGGSMVLVASLNGIVAEPGFADYNASKGGVVLLAQTLALDLVRHHIRVNTVCPGYILTPMTAAYAADPAIGGAIRAAIPMQRFGAPEEVAGAIAFLCSDDASYITGHQLIVDGGRHAHQ
jgi:NAD(P)-dependent dehydrogenase (short-subunit alcohol dehydrogenase family)